MTAPGPAAPTGGSRSAAAPVPAEHAQSLDFGGLSIAFDTRVLRPRAWTVHQSLWAEDLLLTVAGPGRVLELCSGAGQIGLRAVLNTRRDLVCVDADPVAAAYTELNARAAGLADVVEVRPVRLEEAVRSDELFPFVVADPPWVLRADTGLFPEDPLLAIDGGEDGMHVVSQCLAVIAEHLAPGGMALLQLGSRRQVDQVQPILPGQLRVAEVRDYERGVVLRLDLSA